MVETNTIYPVPRIGSTRPTEAPPGKLECFRAGDLWLDPIEIGREAGVISVATAPNPGGGWLAVWSTVNSEDLFNPYPSSLVKYAVSNVNGSNWTTPTVLNESDVAIFETRLEASDSRVHFFCLSTAEGPLSENQAVLHSVWDGTTWSDTVTVDAVARWPHS